MEATSGSDVATMFMVVSFAAVLVMLLIYQSCGCAREEGGEGGEYVLTVDTVQYVQYVCRYGKHLTPWG